MRSHCFLMIGVCIACLLSAGCMTTGIDEISYEEHAFHITIDESMLPEEVIVQIIIFSMQGFHQVEEDLIIQTMSIQPGTDTLTIPHTLEEGTYKFHLFVFTEEKRIAGRIFRLTLEGE
ncbi:hypothetical protein [Methanocalculus natronophilus]|uniref:hypothetical protein n=1 Tax=Methanocalculus natronophilus TaxID=1262400 RepID=UPI0031B6008B